jgi:SAM-dependent methyltransferase
MDSKEHWERVYATKKPTEVSWFQPHPEVSLRLIRGTGAGPDDPIVDVGGGASTLVDDLLAAGYRAVTVLDLSATALKVARERLGPRAASVTWLEADVTRAALPERFFRVWHDRAVFHFLTDAGDRARYVDAVRRAVRPGGHVIVATFALDGPFQCSGLDVVRYDPASLHAQFGGDFDLAGSTEEIHHTPFGKEQKFVYCFCRKD